jgi:hypothetical protein
MIPKRMERLSGKIMLEKEGWAAGPLRAAFEDLP